MRIRLFGAPWWLRASIIAGLVALLLTLFVPWQMPDAVRFLRWPWRAGLLVTVSASLGALVAVLGQPSHRAYHAAVAGLSRAQRERALASVLRGAMPTEPAVLAAAVRLGGWLEQASASKRQLTAQLVFVVGAVTLGSYYLAVGYLRAGAGWWVNALGMAALLGWGGYRRSRIRRNTAAVRAAAADLPGGLDENPASAPQLPVRLDRPALLTAYGALVLVIGAAAALTINLGRPSPDCRTAHAAAVYIKENPDVFTPELIDSPDGPPVTDYRAWAAQLNRYAADTRAPNVAPRLQRIAELAARAVDLVRDSRADPIDSAQRVRAYRQTLNDIVSEEKGALDSCGVRYS